MSASRRSFLGILGALPFVGPALAKVSVTAPRMLVPLSYDPIFMEGDLLFNGVVIRKVGRRYFDEHALEESLRENSRAIFADPDYDDDEDD